MVRGASEVPSAFLRVAIHSSANPASLALDRSALAAAPAARRDNSSTAQASAAWSVSNVRLRRRPLTITWISQTTAPSARTRRVGVGGFTALRRLGICRLYRPGPVASSTGPALQKVVPITGPLDTLLPSRKRP